MRRKACEGTAALLLLVMVVKKEPRSDTRLLPGSHSGVVVLSQWRFCHCYWGEPCRSILSRAPQMSRDAA
ncbi:hypothetical protein O3P69_013308 [Scylla paramamosain]|uniref:Secreted protein n=1 Tax=Scylla paramamosain TaxID=85552 RepID=A0AAW0U0B5_SCYPA